MVEVVKDFAKVTPVGGYSAAATEITLTAGDLSRIPDTAVDGVFYLTWWNDTDYPDPSDDPNRERVRVTASNAGANTITIVRAQDGTSASTKNEPGKTYKMVQAFAKRNYDAISDHGSLNGLSDDDHSQYFLSLAIVTGKQL